jgi:hypothetical protein
VSNESGHSPVASAPDRSPARHRRVPPHPQPFDRMTR